MQLAIKVPEEQYKQTDIAEINVVHETVLTSFAQSHTIDTSFTPVYAVLQNTYFDDALQEIVDFALHKRTNLVTYARGNLHFYRAQEKKKAGREYTGLGVGIILLNDNDEVVLTKRSGTSNNRHGTYDLSGGTVEFGDSLEETIQKEALEETGLEVNPLGCVHVYQDFVEGQHWVSFTYVARVTGGTLKNGEPHKFDEVAYFPVDNLPENTSTLTREGIESYLIHGIQPHLISIVRE